MEFKILKNSPRSSRVPKPNWESQLEGHKTSKGRRRQGNKNSKPLIMKYRTSRQGWKLLLAPLLAAGLIARADDSDRAGKLELAGVGQFMTEGNMSINTSALGSTPIHYGDFYGGGVNFGYNINDHFNVNLTLAGGPVRATT